MWDWFIDFLARTLHMVVGVVGDWGLAVIILTIIIRILLTPLAIKSAKASARMQILAPKQRAIQEKYADDPQRCREEISKFYAENKFNPLSGCLPLLLQLPVFLALLSLLQSRLPSDAHFYNIIGSLSMSASSAVGHYGWQGAFFYVLLSVLSGVFSFLTMYISQSLTHTSMGNQTKIMGIFAVGLGIYVGWTLPIGVVLYYVVSNAWQTAQQVFTTLKVVNKVKEEEKLRLASAPVEVDVVRKEKKPRPHKKS